MSIDTISLRHSNQQVSESFKVLFAIDKLFMYYFSLLALDGRDILTRDKSGSG